MAAIQNVLSGGDDWTGKSQCLHNFHGEAKTGEKAIFSVYRSAKDEIELRASLRTAGAPAALVCCPIERSILEELDEEDPWVGST